MKTSIILSTYNWPEALKIILDKLIPHLNEKTELIIADDGSTAATSDLISFYKSKSPHILHVWHPDNGFQKSMILNKAVALSKGEYLIFLDGDCIPFVDFINEHLKLKQIGYFVAGHRVLIAPKFTKEILKTHKLQEEITDFSLFNWMGCYLFKKTNKLLFNLRLNCNSKWRYFGLNNWRYPKGCNFGIHKNDFMSINGFDEEYSGWGHEDADLFIRLIKNGLKIKNGKFSIPVLHLWHKQANRSNSLINYNKLIERLKDKSIIKTHNGINQWLK